MSGGALKSRGAVISAARATSRVSGRWSENVASAGDEISRDSDAVLSMSRLRNEHAFFLSGHAPLFEQQQDLLKLKEFVTG